MQSALQWAKTKILDYLWGLLNSQDYTFFPQLFPVSSFMELFFFFLNLPLLGKTFRCIRNNQKTAVNEATVEAPKINAVPGVASWVCLQKWVKQHRLPSIFCHLSESGSREQQCKQIPPAVFSSIKPAQIYNPASISWVCPQDIFPMADDWHTFQCEGVAALL